MSLLFHTPGVRILCVDPGLRGCGAALFDGGFLVNAAYVENPVTHGRGYKAHSEMGCAVSRWIAKDVDRLIIEHPRVYPGSAQQKGDPNDLLDVAAVGAAVASWCNYRETETVFPSEWKGQVPKETMTERIRRSLSDIERHNIAKCKASLMHNVLDACGIGLWRLGRINRRAIHNE